MGALGDREKKKNCFGLLVSLSFGVAVAGVTAHVLRLDRLETEVSVNIMNGMIRHSTRMLGVVVTRHVVDTPLSKNRVSTGEGGESQFWRYVRHNGPGYRASSFKNIEWQMDFLDRLWTAGGVSADLRSKTVHDVLTLWRIAESTVLANEYLDELSVQVWACTNLVERSDVQRRIMNWYGGYLCTNYEVRLQHRFGPPLPAWASWGSRE
jgi:hypothetical protein